jgi:hypothetical protein
MNYDVLLVAMIALGGCASVGAEATVASRDAASGAVSICELAAQGLVEGLTARVETTYKTDKSHYAYLSSEGCGKNGVLNVGDLEPISEKSLRDFYDAGEQRCVKKGTPYICVTTVKIDADIRIIRDQEGKLAAELLKVHKFSFAE